MIKPDVQVCQAELKNELKKAEGKARIIITLTASCRETKSRPGTELGQLDWLFLPFSSSKN